MRVVIGGGISGVCCAQELARLNPNEEVVIVTATETLLEAKSVFVWSKYLEEIDIFEKTADQFVLSNPNIRIVQDTVDHICVDTKSIHLKDSNSSLLYSQLCLCTGVRPKLIAHHDRIYGIRDLFSVQSLVERLQTARTIVVVGNGGIAQELAHELQAFDVHWVVREQYIGAAFFDESASAFIMPQLLARHPNQLQTPNNTKSKNMQRCVPESVAPVSSTAANSAGATTLPGSGLGPAWLTKAKFHSQLSPDLQSRQGYLQMHLSSEIAGYTDNRGESWQWLFNLQTPPLEEKARTLPDNLRNGLNLEYPFHVITTLGEIIGCDVVISATGVQANHCDFIRTSKTASTLDSTLTSSLQVDDDDFILVSNRFETSIADIFAAGDCCHYQPLPASSEISSSLPSTHFFQMRLWTQARIMGTYVAQCMCKVEEDYGIDQHLELFAHVTRFFGYKVVLLGRYNAQGLGEKVERIVKRTLLLNQDNSGCVKEDEGKLSKKPKVEATAYQENVGSSSSSSGATSCELEIWSRITPNKQFVKLVVYRGRIIGALLIGDTEMEEVFENLILNQLNISSLGQDILDPDLDLGDYFD